MGRGSSLPADAPGPAIGQPGAIEHVVGIGASAGGLEALQDLASHLVAGGGVSYVVAQHLAPEHRSLIVDLLAHATGLTVVTARDGAPLLPNVIAIAPPNHDVAVEGDRLKLSDPLPRFGPSPCIDLLFESIAEHWGERGVAVVLSGTGADGARGVRAVRVAGGLTLAQSPESAKFDAMPRAAISLGGADLVLDPAAIGRRLAQLIATGGPWSGGTPPLTEPVRLDAVTGQLKHVTGIDFSQYKDSTLRRQLQRRMAIRQVGSLEAYLPVLAAEPEEAQALVQNLLVTVTEFFRDPQSFDALRELLREYVDQRGSGERLRVWVPGCATGKEVYSIAMVVSEVLGHPADLATHLKIFGTDLDEPSLMIGRRAIYPISAAKGIPADLRRRFVIEHGEEMEISEGLRNCAVFARHDVGADPPFPNLDLISCRNTLIYFTPPMQERVLSLFRFGLLPGGLLFLGSSESLGGRTVGFAVANAEHRLFRRTREEAARQRSPLTTLPARQPLPFTPASRIAVLRETVPEQHMALLEGLVRAICPPALVLDENHDLVEVIGDVTPYCRLPEGRMSAAAHAFLLPELQSEARALFLLARADGLAVGSQPLKLAASDRSVRLEARSIRVSDRAFTVLTFAPPQEPANAPAGSPATARDAAFDREIERLERELLSSQDSLRRSLAELEQANEELEASSEELQASSEELQSSNEELEASNEELQATNDELGTLNAQLRARSDELEQLNVDLENIQTSLSQGMVIVDPQLRVSRFSPLAVRVFGLVDSDIGQPLLGVPTTVPLPGLREAFQAVLGGEPRRSLEAGSEEVSYLVQVLPYLERDGRRRGAIVTLTDVSELVELRRTAEAALDEFAGLTDALDQAVWKWDRPMQHLLYASKRIQSLTGWTPVELCDRPALLDEAIDPADRGRVTAAREPGQRQWSVRYRLSTRDGRQIWVLETARVVSEGSQPFVVGTLADVTALQELEDRASELSATFESVFDARSFGVIVLDAQLRVVMANQTFCAMVGFDQKSIVGVSTALFAPEAVEELSADARAALAGSRPTAIRTLQIKGPQGSLHPVQAEIRALPQPSARAVITLIVHDPTVPGVITPGRPEV
ncbi:MAG: chemotaxis protein CheB [Prochlorococcaceae cyanobacterium]